MDKQLAGVLAEVFSLGVSEIRPDLDREEVGTWDSLKQMDLVVSLEREYGIHQGETRTGDLALDL